ncbi:hypothetical protein FHG87_006849 [Trinorchestia longiramus]|nr:hypothetical protein FHG87_006849 [Trinorchestia longiramus]
MCITRGGGLAADTGKDFQAGRVQRPQQTGHLQIVLPPRNKWSKYHSTEMHHNHNMLSSCCPRQEDLVPSTLDQLPYSDCVSCMYRQNKFCETRLKRTSSLVVSSWEWLQVPVCVRCQPKKAGVGKVVDIDPWGSRTELKGSINLWGSEGGRLRIYMVEAGFSHANAILTKQRNRLNFKNRGDLRLKLTNFKPNINSLAAAHQGHPSH